MSAGSKSRVGRNAGASARRRACTLAAVALLAVLGGCGSTPPTRYFVLGAEVAAAPEATQPTLGILNVEVSEYLLVPQILSMDGQHRMYRAEFARWAEPLDKGIARVLSLNLATTLGSQGVRLAPWPREWVPQHELRLRVQRLDAYADSAVLIASWSLGDGARSVPPRDRQTRLSRPRSGTDPEALAADFSALLADLARAIAAEIPATTN